MSPVPESNSLQHLYREAEDLASQSDDTTNTAHLLLGLFTFPNPAGKALELCGINEVDLIGAIDEAKNEPAKLFNGIRERAQRTAANFRSDEVGCLHLLVVITKEPEALAYRILEAAGLDLRALRTDLMSCLVQGNIPNRYGTAKVPAVELDREKVDRRYGQDRRSQSEATTSARARPQSRRPPAPVKEREAPAPRPERPPQTQPTEGAELDPERFPLLNEIGRNLTAEARKGLLDPLVFRHAEVDRIVDILNKRRGNNPCLVGRPGVGKTAIVEGLARALALEPDRVPGLAGREIIALDTGALLAGTAFRGSLSERIRTLRDEVAASDGKIVIFFDEIHGLLGTGSDGQSDAAQDLKTALSRGEFPCIGATTEEEYRRRIEADSALARRFVEVHIQEPSLTEAIAILEGLKTRYEAHHGVAYDDEALVASVRLSHRYLPGRCLPDKALHLMDLAASHVRRQGGKEVGEEDVAQVAAIEVRVPVERLSMSDAERLLRMEQEMSCRIVGHPHVVERLAGVVRRNQAGFAGQRPIGSFLFLGPTGVGKTETAKALADYLFSTNDALLHLDMSEYAEAHTVARLIGAPPGYVGHEDGGQLTESVRRRPYQVVLLDEIEKASLDVAKVLLQVLDEGRLTDGRGRTVDFSNTVLVLTSNLGSELFANSPRRAVGFGHGGSANEDRQSIQMAVLEAAKSYLPIELFNRIDERMVFFPLTKDAIAEVAKMLIRESSKRLTEEREISYRADDRAVSFLIENGGWSPELGARPMRQTVQRLLEGPLAEGILRETYRAGDQIMVRCPGDALVFERAESERQLTLEGE